MKQPVVAIFGTARAQSGSELYEQAKTLGALLASGGFAIANGGYNGTMRAAAEGASQHGGQIIGVTCSAFKRGKANEYVTREMCTANLEERLNTLIELGDAYIILPGGTGTLLELAHVWELKNKHFISSEKPIILLGEFWKPVIELVAKDDRDSQSCVAMAQDPLAAVRIIESQLQGKH